jgi:Fe-S cluster biogenesis protein NfuA
MFIMTEQTVNPARMKFLPGATVLSSGTVEFRDAESSTNSPLARSLFEIDGVTGVDLDLESISVSKSDNMDWQTLKPVVLGAIMNHYTSGEPVILDRAGAEEAPEDADGDGDEDADPEVIATIRNLIDTRIKPAAADSGGDVKFHSFKDGVVMLEITGSAHGLLDGIKSVLRHYVPGVKDVVDYRDAMPKPGLETDDGKAIRRLLDEKINPQVAGHGGHIALVDVLDDTVYIRLEGGCQGCGMADVTLKQGVATQIRALVPAIVNVLDVTDHAGGSNPYYQPGKGGEAAF